MNPPLFTAIQNHDLATVRHLLGRNVSPNEPYDDPPLIRAIQLKHLDIIQLLYEYHVQGFSGEFHDTEIHVAASFGHLPILEFIWNQRKSRLQHGLSGQRGDLHRGTSTETLRYIMQRPRDRWTVFVFSCMKAQM